MLQLCYKLIHKKFTKKDLTYSQICARANMIGRICPGAILDKRRKGRLPVLLLYYKVLYSFLALLFIHSACKEQVFATAIVCGVFDNVVALFLKLCIYYRDLCGTATVWTLEFVHSSTSSATT